VEARAVSSSVSRASANTFPALARLTRSLSTQACAESHVQAVGCGR
jgi:hypothetical protein